MINIVSLVSSVYRNVCWLVMRRGTVLSAKIYDGLLLFDEISVEQHLARWSFCKLSYEEVHYFCEDNRRGSLGTSKVWNAEGRFGMELYWLQRMIRYVEISDLALRAMAVKKMIHISRLLPDELARYLFTNFLTC
jgi:hypothetical protein